MPPLQTALRHATTWAYTSPRSPVRRWRSERMRAFLELVDPPPGARILDLGGTPFMWSLVPTDLHVTLVNLPGSRDLLAPGDHRFSVVAADACELGDVFADGAFDVVFSNSVIEHVGDPSRQARFAAEVRRLAPSYWVQTPSPRFPVEAHTGVPFYWQRGERARERLMRRWERDLPEWAEMIAGTRVLSSRQMRALFPDAEVYRERLLGLEKSVACYRVGA